MRKVNKFADVESEKAQLDARIESAGQAKNTTETSEQVKDAEAQLATKILSQLISHPD
jgi:hypothetical protein